MESLQNLQNLHDKFRESMTPKQFSMRSLHHHHHDIDVIRNFYDCAPTESTIDDFIAKAEFASTIFYCESQLEYYGINIYSREIDMLMHDILCTANEVKNP